MSTLFSILFCFEYYGNYTWIEFRKDLKYSQGWAKLESKEIDTIYVYWKDDIFHVEFNSGQGHDNIPNCITFYNIIQGIKHKNSVYQILFITPF